MKNKSAQSSNVAAALPPAPTPSVTHFRTKAGDEVRAIAAFPNGKNGVLVLVRITTKKGGFATDIEHCDDIDGDFTKIRVSQGVAACDAKGMVMVGIWSALQMGKTAATLKECATLEGSIVKMFPAARGCYLVAANSEGSRLFYFNGKATEELGCPVNAIESVSEAGDGTVYVLSDTLYRRVGKAWERIQGCEDALCVWAVDATSAYVGGKAGFCAKVEGRALLRFTPPDARDYHAVAVYKGDVYLGADLLGLDVLRGGEVVEFKSNIYASFLFADKKHLFAAGRNEFARYDGSAWNASEFTV